MPFSRQVRAATAQALGALSTDAAKTLLIKHLDADPMDPGMVGYLTVISGADDHSVAALIAVRVPETLITPFPEILITSLPENLAG
jgi:hypothetical protein